jgi:predicted component of type VI protein secretion system
MEAKLVVVGGEAKAQEIQLKLPTVIGRGREASLMVPHPLVSRRHCELYEQDGQLVVRDLGSLNGTYVNNQKVVGEAVLPPGQLLTIGAVTFRAVYEAGAVETGPGAEPPRPANLSETVYAGDVRPVGRQGTTARMPAADATVDATGAAARVTGRDSEFDEVRVDEDWSSAVGQAPEGQDAVASGDSTKKGDSSPDDSDDALNDFLRNLE